MWTTLVVCKVAALLCASQFLTAEPWPSAKSGIVASYSIGWQLFYMDLYLGSKDECPRSFVEAHHAVHCAQQAERSILTI